MTLTMLIITDLTRMSGDRVCIAGVTRDNRTIRPEFQYGVITEAWLFDEYRNVVVRPFTKVGLDLLSHHPQPPHTEDWIVNPNVKVSEGFLSKAERKGLLERIVDLNVQAIFGAEIQREPGFFIRENEGNRSLGTVKAAYINNVSYRCYNGRWDYRISFSDCAASAYRLGVTDLAFRTYLDYLRNTKEQDCDQISFQMTKQLQKSLVFLRIGLARPTWAKHPHCCFLQINGVYSFPDYLAGKCFADFR